MGPAQRRGAKASQSARRIKNHGPRLGQRFFESNSLRTSAPPLRLCVGFPFPFSTTFQPSHPRGLAYRAIVTVPPPFTEPNAGSYMLSAWIGGAANVPAEMTRIG